jgi:hypothetical protein
MAIATKSKTWERLGYTILWVTRTTLKSDIWKNMFDKVCDHIIRGKLRKKVKIPSGLTEMRDIRKYLTRGFLQPCSFKQFSNAAKGSGPLYELLVKRNGAEDPLNKTLIIVDEAHKFFASDLVHQERPDFPAVEKAVFSSYAVSGKDSCRILLMTATPILENPMDFIKMMNLFIANPNKRMPTTMTKFLTSFPVDEKMDFLPSSFTKFQSIIKGKISYLDQRWDPRKFTQPVFHNIDVPINKNNIGSEEQCKDTLAAQDAIADAFQASEYKKCENAGVDDPKNNLISEVADEIPQLTTKIALGTSEIMELKKKMLQEVKEANGKEDKATAKNSFTDRIKIATEELKGDKARLKDITSLSKKNKTSNTKIKTKCIKDAKKRFTDATKKNLSNSKLCMKNVKQDNKLLMNSDQSIILKEKCNIPASEIQG